MHIAARMLLLSGRAPFVGPLDAFAGQLYAVLGSHRALSSYTGPGWRVQRSIDEGEEDVGFDSNGWVDKDWLLSVAAGGSLTIVRDYDRTGNGHDGVPDSSVARPRCVLNGVVDVGPNGHPCPVYDGINDSLALQNSLGFLRNASAVTMAVISQTSNNAVGLLAQAILPTAPYTINAAMFYTNATTVSVQARPEQNVAANTTINSTITSGAWVRQIGRVRFADGVVDCMTNGATQSSAMSPAQNAADVDASSPVRVGSNAALTSFLTGRISQSVFARASVDRAALNAAFTPMMP